MVRLHQTIDTLDMIPFLPAGTTGNCKLKRQGNIVTVHSGAISTTGSGAWPTISLPDGWAPASQCLLFFWQWDNSIIRNMQWETTRFRAGSAPIGPQLGTRIYLFGSWVV